jgi:hypothetical protein
MKLLFCLKRSILFLTIVLIGKLLYSQRMPIDKTTGKVTYTGEVKVANTSKAELTEKK